MREQKCLKEVVLILSFQINKTERYYEIESELKDKKCKFGSKILNIV